MPHLWDSNCDQPTQRILHDFFPCFKGRLTAFFLFLYSYQLIKYLISYLNSNILGSMSTYYYGGGGTNSITAFWYTLKIKEEEK